MPYEWLNKSSSVTADEWLNFNTLKISKKLNTSLAIKLFDPKKAKIREEKMIMKIKENILPDGNIIIITGTDHLDFFKNQFAGSILPLR